MEMRNQVGNLKYKNKYLKSENTIKVDEKTVYGCAGSAFFGVILLGYVCSFRTYLNHVEKHEQLKEIMQHPKAKVAHGDRAKEILNQMNKKEEKTPETRL